MSFHLRPLSGLVLMGMACCASLQAEIALTMAPAGARPECRPGASLDLAVALTGGEAGQEVAWSVWAFDTHGHYQATLPAPPVTALGEGRFRFTAPAGRETCNYLIQASCGELASAPLALHVEDPVSSIVASSPAGTPTPPATPVPAAASPAVADAGAFPFSKLPSDLQSHVVSFAPRTFAPASRQLRAHALWEISHLDATNAHLSDLELVSMVLAHPRATSLTFGRNQGNLTPAGIALALSLNRYLQELATGSAIRASQLAILAATHPHLVRLDLRNNPYEPFTDLQIQLFEDRLTHLKIWGTRLTAAAIQRAARLESLSVRSGGGTWEHLPESLRSLEMDSCDGFTGQGLPQGLTSLGVQHCRSFMPTHLPSSLRSLETFGTGRLQNQHLLDLIRPLAQLTSLSTSVQVDDAFVQALPRTLTSLGLSVGGHLVAPSFTHITHLQWLRVHEAPGFNGGALPEGVRHLAVDQCPNFKAESLAPEVRNHLVDLQVEDCRWTPELLRETLAAFPKLQRFTLRYFSHTPPVVEPEFLAKAHPSLLQLTVDCTILGPDGRLHSRTWRRPATPHPVHEEKAPATVVRPSGT